MSSELSTNQNPTQQPQRPQRAWQDLLTKPALIQALWVARDPTGFFRFMASQRPLFALSVPGIATIHATGTSTGAKQIFSAPAEIFAPVTGSPIEPLLGRNAMMVLDGERHARERRIMMPCFGMDKINALASRMITVVEEEIGTLPINRPIALQAVMQRLALKIIVDVIFGVTDSAERAAFVKVTETFLTAYTPSLMLIPALRRSAWYPWRRFLNAQRAFDELLLKKVVSTRQAGAMSAHPGSMLTILQGARGADGAMFSDEELRDELRTLLIAGHETSATAMTWAMYYILKDQSVEEQLRAELAASDGQAKALAQLPYLGAVCQEALRIHPVVPIAIRALKAKLNVCDQEISAGDNVAVVISLLHRDPSLYPDPDAFRPQRFLERKFATHEYAPFGGGFRRCIGASFAQTEMRMVIATLMKQAVFKLHGNPQPKVVTRNITTGPDRTIWLRRVQ